MNHASVPNIPNISTTVVVQLDDIHGTMLLLGVTPEEALAGLIRDGYHGAYIHDGKVYLPPIYAADHPHIRTLSEEEWQAAELQWLNEQELST